MLILKSYKFCEVYLHQSSTYRHEFGVFFSQLFKLQVLTVSNCPNLHFPEQTFTSKSQNLWAEYYFAINCDRFIRFRSWYFFHWYTRIYKTRDGAAVKNRYFNEKKGGIQRKGIHTGREMFPQSRTPNLAIRESIE